MQATRLLFAGALLLLLAVPGCSGIRAEGQVCFNPEFLKLVPFVGSVPDMTTERCIGGKVGGQVLTPMPPRPAPPPPPTVPPPAPPA